MAGQQGDVCVSHGLDRVAGRLLGGDGSLVLVDDDDPATAERTRLVEDAGNPAGVGPYRRPAGMVVDRHGDVVADAMHREVQVYARGSWPPALQHIAVDVDAHHVVRPELVPQEIPRVGEKRSVGLLVGDVAGQMVVVALVPQGARQQHELLLGGQRRQQ